MKNKVKFGIKKSSGGLRSNQVRAALYYAKKRRLAKAEPYVNDAYVDSDYAEFGHPVDARYSAFDYVIQGYAA